MYRVNEIFYSLQGEGFWTGTPAVFLRFSGCNLRCPFCDTDFTHAQQMDADQILAAIAAAGKACKHVIVTGGEPALQLDQALVDRLHEEGYTIHIETNGTKPLPSGIDWITCSPKQDWLPGAAPVIEKANELKMVYTGQNVEKWLEFKADHYFLQPCSCQNTKEVVTYILSHPRWRLSLQTHKYLDIR
ncbi:MAG: 7-carboxy-7-deazaguanine synthase QueE [Bacteroidales bacterium]|nr:7-carboxy-7-deazaguanine synthase QueE [Bacteroidales bacterium]